MHSVVVGHVCTEPLNDVNKAGASRMSQPVDTVNIPSDAADVSDVERLVHSVAAEMNIDAQRAIEDLKKDKDLWNRVERLKHDAAARQGDVNERPGHVGLDAGICHFPVFELESVICGIRTLCLI